MDKDNLVKERDRYAGLEGGGFAVRCSSVDVLVALFVFFWNVNLVFMCDRYFVSLCMKCDESYSLSPVQRYCYHSMWAGQCRRGTRRVIRHG